MNNKIRKNISSASPFEKQVGFSRAVKVGNQVFVAGTAPIGEDGKSHGIGDVYAQAKRCFQIMEWALEEAGSGTQDVVRTRMFLVNPDDWEEVARAHADFFRDIQPAATMIAGIKLLNPEWLIEIEADAVVVE